MLIDRVELRTIIKTLNMPPSSLVVLYGPRSTGKTTIIRAAAMMHERSSVLVDMRGAKYRSWKDALFLGKTNLVDRFREVISSLITRKRIYFGIEDDEENAFEWLSLRNIGLIAIDEIQEADPRELCSLSEFLIFLSKNEGLVHSLIASSDPFLVLKLLDNCNIAGSSELIKVGEIDEASSLIFLQRNGLSKKQAEFVIENMGSRPIDLISAVKYYELERLKEWVNMQINLEIGRIERNLRSEKEKKIIFNVLEGKDRFRNREEEIYLVEKEILFLDPVSMKLEFESTLTKNAAKKLREVEK